MTCERPRFLPGGDSALFVEFGDTIDPETNRRVRCFLLAVDGARIPGVIETVPAYRSLLVYYEPRRLDPWDLRAKLELLAEKTEEGDFPEPAVTEIPTVYGGEYGPDLDFVAEHNGLSPDEVISIHSGKAYLIYMLGFMPGFAYLGGLSSRIGTPRLATPREKIPAGSVGIAGKQTGIYPTDSPGGWQLIGMTPLKLFCPDREPPALLRMGDYVRFVPVAAAQFSLIRGSIEQGTYRVREAPFTEDDET
jgi:inhibitor of KinA